jgi:hypothetical protein
MKTTRRDFLKLLGLGTLGTLLSPNAALAELTHGASDLSPRERDVVADVMGLRREQWVGWDLTPTWGGDNARFPYSFEDDALGDVTVFGFPDSGYPPFGKPWSEIQAELDARPSVAPDDLLGQYGGRGEIEITVHGTWAPGAEDALREIYAECARGNHLTVDNLGLTIEAGTTIIGLNNSDRPTLYWKLLTEHTK